MSEPAVFAAMGCEVVVSGASPRALATIQALFEEWEQVFSRFRDDSELSRVNRSRSPVVAVSPLFASTLRRALAAARLTGGLVDPTLGQALLRAGYDRDFAQLQPEPADVSGAVEPAPCARAARGGAASRIREVRIAGRLVARPVGLHLDLNGVVKSLAVDDALAHLDRPGFVSAGGDLAVRGPAVIALPTSAGAGAAHALTGPAAAAPAVRVERGGLATSGRALRRWFHGGAPQHHLIDPATGLPSATPWECVTVLAGSCHDADVAAKAAFLAGAAGPAWLDERALAGRFLLADGTVLVNESWRAELERDRSDGGATRFVPGAPACS